MKRTFRSLERWRGSDMIVDKLLYLGYDLEYRDGKRFVSMYKDFGNSQSTVNNSDELQIGRSVEIYDGKIHIKPFMKRGWMWASSAEIQKTKGNIYTHSGEMIFNLNK